MDFKEKMDKAMSYKGLSLSDTSGMSYLLLFILWPFLAFIFALMNYSKIEARRLVYIFLVYFGLTFVSDSVIMDSYRYVETFRFFGSLPMREFFRAVSGYYSYSGSADFLEPLIAFLLSRLTVNHHIYFAVFAALFAFFYLRSFNLIYDQFRESPNRNAWLFMVFSLIVIPITSLSVLRMWIAAWMFFYGTFLVLSTRKPKYLLVALSACLMHWSFISLNLLLIAWFFAGNRNFIYTPLAIGSFFFSTVIDPLLQLTANFFGGSIASRVEGYTSQSHALEYQDWLASNSWFLLLSHDLIWYFFIGAIAYIRIFRRKTMQGKLEKNWYSYLLLVFTLVNLGRSIPDFGMRMQTVFILFASVYLFLYFKNLGETRIRLLTVVGLFPILLYTLIQFRIGADSLNAWIFTPGCGLPFLDPNLSLTEVLFK